MFSPLVALKSAEGARRDLDSGFHTFSHFSHFWAAREIRPILGVNIFGATVCVISRPAEGWGVCEINKNPGGWGIRSGDVV